LKQLQLNAKIRTTSGNGPARALRRRGMVPAVLYGPQREPVMLSLEFQDLEHAVQKGNLRRTIFALDLQNSPEGTRPAVIKEVQTHPVTGAYLHVDFYEIDMQRKLRVKVPVVTKGKAKGEDFGGMLQAIEREIEVSCLPGAIPDAIEIDVTELGIGSTLHVRDIQLPEGVELPPGDNYTVLTVLSQKAEAAPAAPGAEEGAEEGAEKKAEDQAGEE
jgi:large subunit ribosomal protein L25